MKDQVYSIQTILDAGIDIIPVNEKSKVPLVKWKDKDPLSFLEIITIVQSSNQYAFAMILGKRSQNLICIDVDTKYKQGFGLPLLKEIQDLYPNTWKKLRVEKTVSGGFHILYRVSDTEGLGLVADEKVAVREATPEELLENPKIKEYCFIELKFEGGISQCYPSVGYSVYKESEEVGLDIVVSYLTREEHQNLYAILSSHNEVAKRAPKEKKESKFIEEYYDENPYEHYNKSEEGSKLLEKHGWSELKSYGGRVYYRRPGKSEGTSGSFSLETRLFSIFTSSTEVDPKSYTASNLRCELEFNGDKKELYEILVAEGYGRIKPNVEKKIVERRAKFGGDLPPNVSEKGKEHFLEVKEEFEKSFPFGVFWSEDEDGVIKISQKGIDDVLFKMGYRIYRGELVLIKNWLLCHITDQFSFNALLLYIGDQEEVYNAYSRHIDKYGKLTINRLRENAQISDEQVLRSSRSESFKFYSNSYVSITSDGFVELKYEDIADKYVVEREKLDREFKFVTKEVFKQSMYYKYLSLALGEGSGILEGVDKYGKIPDSVFKSIGYLTHDYIDDSMSAIFMATEKCENPDSGGGSGKNIFFNILNNVTSVHVINGRQVELDKNLLQAFNGERVLVISDVHKDFDVSFFKDFSSGAASLKKLYKDVVVLKRNMMPKPVILTNFSYKKAPGLERRIIDLEFNEYFSRLKGGVKKEFGCMFPSFDSKGDWDELEWNCFDSIIVFCIEEFLKAGELDGTILSEGGWRKQYHQTYSHILEFIEGGISGWLDTEHVDGDVFKKQYEVYCHENNINKRYEYSWTKMNTALSEYCIKYDIEFDANAVFSEAGIKKRGKKFRGSPPLVVLAKAVPKGEEAPF